MYNLILLNLVDFSFVILLNFFYISFGFLLSFLQNFFISLNFTNEIAIFSDQISLFLIVVFIEFYNFTIVVSFHFLKFLLVLLSQILLLCFKTFLVLTILFIEQFFELFKCFFWFYCLSVSPLFSKFFKLLLIK